jgi:hypothetical protein
VLLATSGIGLPMVAQADSIFSDFTPVTNLGDYKYAGEYLPR